MRPLHVVGPAWMAQDLGAVHDRGFDPPAQPADFWCSGEHYARLTDVSDIRFSTPGGMLPLLGLRPGLDVRSAVSILDDPPSQVLFTKLNDLKLASFPARVRTPTELIDACQKLAESVTDPAEVMIATMPILDFAAEARCIVYGGEVVSVTAYSNGRGWLGRGLDDVLDDIDRGQIARVASNLRCPLRAYVVDVGWCQGNWTVIETNPVASSFWYADAPDPVVAKAIRAGQHDDPAFDWTQPMLLRRRRWDL